MQFVILGAGYAGLRTALDLDRRLRERGRPDHVVLVDQHDYHQIIQVLHLAATAAIDSHKAIYELPPLLRHSAIEFVQGHVEAIAPLDREVRLDDGRRVPYDRLVIALGAETAYDDVPGAHDHALPLRSYEQALYLRKHVTDQFATAARTTDPREQRILLTTAIVGGGYTGCQIAGELPSWADDLCRETGAPRNEVRIALLDRNPTLLRELGEWASPVAVHMLDQMGVSVYMDTAVHAVEPGLLRVSDGRVLRAATIIWAGGVHGPAILARSGLPVDTMGRVLVDRYLRVFDQGLIFAMGDCAAIPDPATGMTVPSTGSYAMRQGEHMADTLFAEAEGEPPRTYEPIRLGELMSLGPNFAMGNPMGIPITGYPALVMKKGVEYYYRGTIEPPA